MKTIIVTLVLVLHVPHSHAQTVPASASVQNTARVPTGAIGGVVQGVDGQPAAGIRVVAVRVTDANAAEATAYESLTQTDGTGRYRLENVPPGRYHVMAGFVDAPTYFPGVKTADEARVILVEAEAAVTNIDFTLSRSAGVRVAGRVTGIPSDWPPAMARVALGSSRPVANSVPDTVVGPDGAFEFFRVTPGSYVALVRIGGQPVLQMVAFGQPGSQLVPPPTVVVTDRDVAGLELTMPPLLLGRVEVEGGGLLAATDPGVAPSPDAPTRVVIEMSGTSGATWLSGVRRDGYFTLPATPGDYRIGLRAFGYYMVSAAYGDADLQRGPLHIDKTVSTTPIRITLTTTPPADAKEFSISGKVRGFAEQRTSGWMVQLTELGEGAVGLSAEVPVRPDGTFEAQHITPGTWILQTRQGNSLFSTRAVIVENRNVEGVELNLPANVNQAAQPVNPRAAAAGSGVKITGKIIQPNPDTPMPITLRLTGPPPRESSPTSDGSFSFSDVPPGTYTLNVAGLYGTVNTKVVVGDRDVADVRVEMPLLVNVKGQFIVNGAPTLPNELRSIQLLAVSRGGTHNSPSAGGQITLRLPVEEYSFSVAGLPGAYSVDSIAYGDLDLRTTPLQIDAPLSSEITVRISPFPPADKPLPRVAGKVTNMPAATFASDPKVVLTRDTQEGGGEIQAAVAADGSFEFKGTTPGSYTLKTAGLNSFATRKVEIKDADISNLTVELAMADNPFPGYPGASEAATFNMNAVIVLRGVLTQELTPLRAGARLMYLRIEVPDEVGVRKSWAVMLGPIPSDIPDMGKLKVGSRITISGNPARDGSKRVYAVPLSPANTTIGIQVDPN